jgi:myosin heavy subunit
MTVEDLAARLEMHGVGRDARTIQRWCRSGKIQALIDSEHSDRWLIEPASAQSLIDDMVQEMSRRPHAMPTVSPSVPRQVATAHDIVATRSDHRLNEPEKQSPQLDDNDATSEPVATTSADESDTVATLRKQVSKLEMEKVQLQADVKSRESFNEYIKEQFESTLDAMLDRSERLGELQAENRQLRAALPDGGVDVAPIVNNNPRS